MDSLKKYETRLVALGLLLLLLITKASVLSQPLFWDEFAIYVLPGLRAFDYGIGPMLTELFGYDIYRGHPPLFALLLGIPAQAIGYSPFMAHAFALLFSWGLLFAVYLVGRSLGGFSLGFLAALCSFSLPPLYAQSAMYLPDIALAALALFWVHWLEQKRERRAGILGLFLGMIHLSSPGIALPGAILYGAKATAKARLWLLTPLLSLGFFFFMQHQKTGHFIMPSALDDLRFSLTENFTRAESIASYVFLAQRRWILSIPALLGLWWTLNQERRLPFLIHFFWLTTALFIFALSFDRDFLNRYMSAGLVFFTIGSLYLSTALFSGKAKPLLWVLAFVFMLSSFSLHQKMQGSKAGFGHEENMLYLRIVTSHKEAVQFVEEHYKEKRIFANWPMSTNLKEPEAGYVKSRMAIVADPESPFDIAVFTENGYQEHAPALTKLIQGGALRAVRTTGEPHFQTVIYERVP